MPIGLYGDSYGGIMQAQLAREAGDRQERMNAMAQALAIQEANRKEIGDTEKLDFEKQQAARNQANLNREVALRQQDTLWQHDKELSGEAINRGYLGVQQQQLDWQKSQPTASAVRGQDFDLTQAVQGANNADYDSTEHVMSVFPTIGRPRAQVIFDRSKQAGAAQWSDYQRAQQMADVSNRRLALANALPKDGEGHPITEPPPVHWYSGADTKKLADQVTANQAEYKQLGTVLANVPQAQRSLIYFNNDNNSYVSAVPPPRERWRPPMQGPPSPPQTATGNPVQAAPASYPDTMAAIRAYRPAVALAPQDQPAAAPGPTASYQMPMMGQNAPPSTATAAAAPPPPQDMPPAGMINRPRAAPPLPQDMPPAGMINRPRSSPFVVQRVNELIHQGYDPATAKRMAMEQEQVL